MALLEDDTAQLREYTLAKQQVTACVRALKQLLEAYRAAPADTPGTPGTSVGPSMSDNIEQAQSLVVKLAEDWFNLAVVGQFKRGKSSLMNAVIGRDLLPTGPLPLTSAITTLCYGPEEQVFLRRKGWSIEQKISLGELPEYITERGNPGNEKELVEARLELPVRFLRRGLYFIDTPGVGSIRQENTATTYTFLPEADAVIFVTSVDPPLSETEQTFLRDIRDHVHKLFIVVNKIDLLNPDQRDDVLDYIRAGVNTTLGTEHVRLYPVSAQQALGAKLNRDTRGLQQSGLLEMEEALARFLTHEQGRAFLVAVLDRALSLLTDIGDIGISSGSGCRTTEDRRPSTATDPTDPTEITVDDLRGTMESLRAALLDNAELSQIPTGEKPGSSDGEAIEKAIAATRTRQGQRQRRVRDETCPICFAQSQAIFDFFAHWQYALSTSESAQQAFTAAHGFCPVHTWQFQQIASPLGVSEGYAPLIETMVVDLHRLLAEDDTPEQTSGRIEAFLSGTETCAACRVLRETETQQMSQFLTRIASTQGKEFYSRSEGLCLPHLCVALATIPDREVRQFLLQEQVRRLQEISEDMRGYTLKRDALRRQLLNTQEEDAWRRALVQLVGEQTARVTGERRT